MRLNNYSYNYRVLKLTLKQLLTIKIEHGVRISVPRTQYHARATMNHEVGVVISISA